MDPHDPTQNGNPAPDSGETPGSEIPTESSFRDRLATVDESGGRIWIHPRKPKGRFHSARRIVAWALLALFVAIPFLRIGGHPVLRLDIAGRHFTLLGKPFWPQDFHLFVILLISLFVAVFLFTVVYGRLWCGWACPQTIFMEMVFRKIEYLIDGNAGAQKKLARRPWDGDKILRRGLKHSLFVLVSLLVASITTAYFIGTEDLAGRLIRLPVTNPVGFAGFIAFAGVFYFVFAWFREQACTLVCPYGRLQGVMLDSGSICVSYDPVRGEPRMPVKRAKNHEDPGDCIDCGNCVRVCPTGIDIRNGTQLECINCTACMDACDGVMDKLKRPRGLIQYASADSLEHGTRWKPTPRAIGYSIILLGLLSLFVGLLALRPDVETTVLRTPGTLYEELEDGRVRNLYSVKIINKTFDTLPLELELLEPAGGELRMVAGEVEVASNEAYESAFFVVLPLDALEGVRTDVHIAVMQNGRTLETVKTTFLGPTGRR